MNTTTNKTRKTTSKPSTKNAPKVVSKAAARKPLPVEQQTAPTVTDKEAAKLAARDKQRLEAKRQKQAEQRDLEAKRAAALDHQQAVQKQAKAMVAEARATLCALGGRAGTLVSPAHKAAYTVSKVEGRRVIDNDDPVSRALRGVKLEQVYTIAARILNESEAELRAAYAKLNAGQQSMALRNRIRGEVKADASVLAGV